MHLKTYFCLLIVLLTNLELHAQPKKFDNIFSVGVRAGMNSSSVSFTPAVQQGNLIGPVMGVTARYQSENYAALSVELNYSKKGWSETLEGDNSYSRKFTTIEIPMFATFIIGLRQNQHININMGPQLDFIIGDQETINLTDLAPKIQYGMPLYNKTLFALSFGVEYEWQSSIGNFIADFRYCYTFVDIFPNHATDDFTKSQLNVMTVGLGYMIPWTKLWRKK